MKWLYKILMNQADSSPGGGAAPAASPQAQGGAAPAATPPVDVSSIVQQTVSGVRDSIFAELRRAGVLGGDGGRPKGKETPSATPAPSPDPSPSLSHSDVQRVAKFQRALGAAGLSSDQESIVETLFEVERPEVASIGDWVAAKAKAMGISRAGNPNPTNPTGQTTPARPASDAGAPAAPATFTEDTPLLSLSAEDRAALIKQKGLTWYRQTLQRQMKGVRVTIRRR